MLMISSSHPGLYSLEEENQPSYFAFETYEPKMVAHIGFMFRIYLELHLECYWNNQKYKKSEAWCCLGFRP